jgi:hypothetical protein
MVGLCKARVTALLEHFRAADASLAGQKSQKLCSACQGPIGEARTIAGVDVYCGPCGAAWEKSGKVPNAATT